MPSWGVRADPGTLLGTRVLSTAVPCPLPERPAPDLSARAHLQPPRLHQARFAAAPDARFVAAPADGVLPEGFFSTTNLPTYVRIGGRGGCRASRAWIRRSCSTPDGALWVREGRRVRKGDQVAVGEAEDGREGIFVHATAFMEEVGSDGEFKFMIERGLAREADRLRADGADARGRARPRRLSDLGRRAGARALARARRHDVVHRERLRRRAARGQRGRGARHRGVDLRHHARHERRRAKATQGGHGLHMRAINKVRAAGSIAAAVERGHDHATASCTPA